MNRGTLGEMTLQVFNVLLGLSAIGLIVRGFWAGDGLGGLGLALLATASIGWVGFGQGIAQQAARTSANNLKALSARPELKKASGY